MACWRLRVLVRVQVLLLTPVRRTSADLLVLNGVDIRLQLLAKLYPSKRYK